MHSDSEIKHALEKLIAYIENENFKGYDPYDGLNSPLFKLPILRSNKSVRFLSQQFIKRFPVNLRPLLGIKKGCNPVTLGLCIQGYTSLLKLNPEKETEIINRINHLVELLEQFIPEGFHGACWGYDFDWEARYASIPAYQPTIVATGIITNALFQFYRQTGNEKAFKLCESAAEFVLKDLNRTSLTGHPGYCFSYSPFDKQVVFNASMKAVRLLSQVYSINKNELLKRTAQEAASFVMSHQREDGAWIYSQSKAGNWIDNYHTGYILDCLKEFQSCCNDHLFAENLERGFKFYRENFFLNDGQPKFYHNNPFPVDCTAAAQSILTLTSFGEKAMAGRTAEFMIRNMQGKNGAFYFRKHKMYLLKTSFMRWSHAWMFAALAYFQTKK
jgi:hypothetical protein